MLKKLFVACAFLAPGCVSVPEAGKQPILATHVRDWREEVIYQVLIDRFANGDVNNDFRVQEGALARYQGGDWKGIEDHLDYFTDLGITTLWISPVVKNVETDADVDGYHGYWAQDLTEPNPHFGDLAALRSMVAAAHDHGLKVVLDIVTNHMGQVFYYDMNLNGHPDIYIGGTGCDPNSPGTTDGSNKNPPPPQGDGSCMSQMTRITEFDPDFDYKGVQAYTSLGPAGRAPIIFINDPSINRVPPKPDILATRDAYHGMGRTLNYDIPIQLLNGDFPGGLKDVATENPQVRAAMIDAYARWVELVDFDGFRIDTVKHVEDDFWRTFAPGVRQRLAAQGKGKFLMFGEAFDGRDGLLGHFTQPGMLDSVFYFSQHFEVIQRVFEWAHDPTRAQGTDNIKNLWALKPQNYSQKPQDGGIGVAPSKALVNFLDNHDVSRFLFEAEGDKDALKNALTFIMTEEGIPCVYYGTEQEFSGGNDPSNREILWSTGFDRSKDTFQHFRKLARLRKGYSALQLGDTNVLWSSAHVAQEEDAGIFAFERAGGDAGDRYALVVVNASARKASSTSDGAKVLTTSRKGTTNLVDVLDPQAAKYSTDATGALRVTVPPQKTLILIPADQVVTNL
jgi:glycosidase